MLKDQQSFPSRGFWVALVIGVGLLALWVGPCLMNQLRFGNQRARLSFAVSNARQIKLAMDSFAMDHDGMYPNELTASKYTIPTDGSSDTLFRQLFAGGDMESERVFWIQGHPLCNKMRPDDVTRPSGVFAPEETLQHGDNGWAYVMNQTNADNPVRPLLVVSPPGGSELVVDPKLWNGKTVVARIDGSVKPERLNPENRLMDGDHKELLTTESAVWGGDVDEVKMAYPVTWRAR